MAGKVLELEDILQPDQLATQITETFISWDMFRQLKKNDWEEITRYIFATDTSTTTNSQLPWKNKTVIPKVCQIRDNLFSNYTATLFPQRKWLVYEADETDSNSQRKRDTIVNFMTWAIGQGRFKTEIYKIILDYIDKGNAFGTVEWIDERTEVDRNRVTAGYVGPAIRWISCLDIVFNPTAPSFQQAPKIIRSIISLGELKKMFEKMSTDENREDYQDMWEYLMENRRKASSFDGDWIQRDNLYQIDGFTSYRDYLSSGFVEVLTFYGDIYDAHNDEFIENHVITVIDRHKLISKKPNPSYFGFAPIFHVGWRKKPENLWAMGPLENLIGMQYRMDHIENMKADIFDFTSFPVQKIKGFVEDYTWQPGEKIFVSEEGDVELITPDVNALGMNMEIQNLAGVMEEMAGSPKEAMGFRTPGEKTKYEVQRLENAASRIFQNKTKQFEEEMTEPLLNAMLELARRNLTGINTIKVMNEFNMATFQTLTVEDITGIGRIKPIAARHFAEQAELVQNLTSLAGSNLWPFVQQHFSAFKLAKVMEEMFNIKDYEIVQQFVALAEQADGQKYAHALQEGVLQSTTTASGMGEDYDMDPAKLQSMAQQQLAQGPQQ